MKHRKRRTVGKKHKMMNQVLEYISRNGINP